MNWTLLIPQRSTPFSMSSKQVRHPQYHDSPTTNNSLPTSYYDQLTFRPQAWHSTVTLSFCGSPSAEIATYKSCQSYSDSKSHSVSTALPDWASSCSAWPWDSSLFQTFLFCCPTALWCDPGPLLPRTRRTNHPWSVLGGLKRKASHAPHPQNK